MLREFHNRWEFDLKSSPESLWPFVADTNRFNRDTGVPEIEIKDRKKRLRNARRKVRLSIYGLPVEWEEQPFEWIRPSRFGVERTYSKGPMARLRVLAQLMEKPEGGTHLVYEIWAMPRNLLGSIVVPLQVRLVVGPRLRKAIRNYDEMASNTPVESASDSSSQSTFDLQRLAALKQKLIADVESGESPEQKVALDLANVTFVDRDAMGFLCSAKTRKVSIENIPSYVIRWIEQERICGSSNPESEKSK